MNSIEWSISGEEQGRTTFRGRFVVSLTPLHRPRVPLQRSLCGSLYSLCSRCGGHTWVVTEKLEHDHRLLYFAGGPGIHFTVARWETCHLQ